MYGFEEFVDKKYKELISEFLSIINVELVDINEIFFKVIKFVYEIIFYFEVLSNLVNLNGIVFGFRKDGNNWEEIMINIRVEGFGEMV